MAFFLIGSLTLSVFHWLLDYLVRQLNHVKIILSSPFSIFTHFCFHVQLYLLRFLGQH